jgi:hypothetical protein
MHTGYRGTRVGVHTLTITGNLLSYEVAFVDEDGVTHGIMRHTIPIDADPAVQNAANALVTELIKKAARAHYTQPSGFDSTSTPTSTDDLRTALGNPHTEADEPPGAQG